MSLSSTRWRQTSLKVIISFFMFPFLQKKKDSDDRSRRDTVLVVVERRNLRRNFQINSPSADLIVINKCLTFANGRRTWAKDCHLSGAGSGSVYLISQEKSFSSEKHRNSANKFRCHEANLRRRDNLLKQQTFFYYQNGVPFRRWLGVPMAIGFGVYWQNAMIEINVGNYTQLSWIETRFRN